MAGSLEGDVKVPVAGNVPKKAVAGGLLVVGVLVIVYYVRKEKSSSGTAAAAAAAASSTDQYPPDGTVGNPDDPYSTDPATGQTYGDENSGSGGTYGAYGGLGSAVTDTYPWDGSTGDEDDPYSLDPATGVTYGDEGLATGGTGSSTGGPPLANNSAWETWVLQQLEEQDPDIDSGDALTTALGLYLNGQPVSAAQASLIFQATGIGGDPPVAGSSGYPPSVRTNGNTGPAPATTDVVPNVSGMSASAAAAAITAAGLVPNAAEVAAAPAGSVVESQTPGAGKVVASGSTVDLGFAAASAGTATVPNVNNARVETVAVPAIQAAGLVANITTGGPVNPTYEYQVVSQTPGAGARVAKGSKVDLAIKKIT
jgi:PASTA domain